MSQLLDGIRIADLSIVTAGGGSTGVLADFGADVIKVEGTYRPDSFRKDGVRSQNWSLSHLRNSDNDGSTVAGAFTTIGRNKRSIAVDLKNPKGREIAARLVEISDAVVENFRRGAIERLGLGFDELVKIRRDIVLATISSQGDEGPDRLFGSYGSVLDALGGIADLTGYDEATPRWSTNKVNYPDQLVSMFAPALIIGGIMSARETGLGTWIDLSQREVVTSTLGEWVLWSSVTGQRRIRAANMSDGASEWASPCQGDDEWVAISLFGAGDAVRLANVIDRPGLASNSSSLEFGPGSELRSDVEQWSRARTKADAMEQLRASGIAAAAVRKAYEQLDDPVLNDLGFWHEVSLPGGRVERQRGFLVRYDEGGGAIRHRPPLHGEHTSEVLQSLLGYSVDEIASLEEQKVILCRAVADAEPASEGPIVLPKPGVGP